MSKRVNNKKNKPHNRANKMLIGGTCRRKLCKSPTHTEMKRMLSVAVIYGDVNASAIIRKYIASKKSSKIISLKWVDANAQLISLRFDFRGYAR